MDKKYTRVRLNWKALEAIRKSGHPEADSSSWEPPGGETTSREKLGVSPFNTEFLWIHNSCVGRRIKSNQNV